MQNKKTVKWIIYHCIYGININIFCYSSKFIIVNDIVNKGKTKII